MGGKWKTKIGMFLSVFAIVCLVMVVTAINVNQNQLSQNSALCTLPSVIQYGGERGYQDIAHVTVLTTNLCATYYFSNGTPDGSPVYCIHVPNWNIVSSAQITAHGWTHSGTDHVAYGDAKYHVGVWLISSTTYVYSKVTVNPSSPEAPQFTSGYGEYC